ncbi:DNA-directed RNA polymerase subunit alpha [Patescibacteria group bacterium]|nr:DNA-directed RNA polymerase subunit alpha [Patescibacteria group bacterium]MDL1952596.1 DNA-directed RNA polymerase subunit alpha [Candidatus Uhrbacteria bacterium UHB]RIL01272.1 MAG: DNA-directed RNA polymerase subunit alpha [Candidatus Uhrbacteria bacterium]
MESLLLPSKISYAKSDRPHEGILTVEPCSPGYGTTLGNALRRVLLSSLPGAAVTSFKIKGVDHEFSTIEHVKEDVVEIILNLKALRIKLHSEEPAKLFLKASGEKSVTAADFEKDSQIEIANPDHIICTLTSKNANVEMEVTVSPGRGYRTTEDRAKEKLELGNIAIDALYSPVLNVSYKVDATRVGEKTDFDKLILRVETDGTVDPKDAITQGVAILLDHFNLLTNPEDTGA